MPGRRLRVAVCRAKTDQGGGHRRLRQPDRSGVLSHGRAGRLAGAPARGQGSDRRRKRRRTPAVLRRHQGGKAEQHRPVRQGSGAIDQTGAGDAGAGLADLIRQTRHRSTAVALGYLRRAEPWRNRVRRHLCTGRGMSVRSSGDNQDRQVETRPGFIPWGYVTPDSALRVARKSDELSRGGRRRPVWGEVTRLAVVPWGKVTKLLVKNN